MAFPLHLLCQILELWPQLPFGQVCLPSISFPVWLSAFPWSFRCVSCKQQKPGQCIIFMSCPVVRDLSGNVGHLPLVWSIFSDAFVPSYFILCLSPFPGALSFFSGLTFSWGNWGFPAFRFFLYWVQRYATYLLVFHSSFSTIGTCILNTVSVLTPASMQTKAGTGPAPVRVLGCQGARVDTEHPGGYPSTAKLLVYQTLKLNQGREWFCLFLFY